MIPRNLDSIDPEMRCLLKHLVFVKRFPGVSREQLRLRNTEK